MKVLTKQQRRAIGCGYLPRMDGVRVPWWPKSLMDEWGKAERGSPEPVTVCTTYTVSLPEVREVAECYPQWEAHYLTEYLGETPRPDLLLGLAVLKRAANERDAAKMKAQQEAARGHSL